MASLRQVSTHLHLFRPDSRNYPKYVVDQFWHKGMAGFNQIQYVGIVIGETSSYQAQIMFFGIDFQKEMKENYVPITIITPDNRKLDFFHSLPSLDSKTFFKCACPDFAYVFEFPMYLNKALIGNFRRYRRKPGSNRPEKNPKRMMGYCKHLHSMILELKNRKLLK